MRITIVGAGAVGAQTAFALLMSDIATKIDLVDIDGRRAEGEALDLKHGLVYTNNARIDYATSLKKIKNIDILIITAGAAQKPGETRLDLTTKNALILNQILSELRTTPRIVIMISNPVDVLTAIARKLLPKSMVFGTGTSLDSARLRDFIAAEYTISPRNVHASILGEHGDSSFAAWSCAYIAGIPAKHALTAAQRSDFEKRVRSAAYEVINRKGATSSAIALTVTHLCNAIAHDRKEVLPVSTCPAPYGIDDVCLSVPCVIGRHGIERVHVIPLSRSEIAALKRSRDTIKPYLDTSLHAIKQADKERSRGKKR